MTPVRDIRAVPSAEVMKRPVPELPADTSAAPVRPHPDTLQPSRPAIGRPSAPPTASISLFDDDDDENADSTFVGRPINLEGRWARHSAPEATELSQQESKAVAAPEVEPANESPVPATKRAQSNETYADFGLHRDDDPFADFSA